MYLLNAVEVVSPQPFGANGPVVPFDIGILLRLARLNVDQPDPAFSAHVWSRPLPYSGTNGQRPASPRNDLVQRSYDAVRRQREVHLNYQAFAVEVIQHVQLSEGPTIYELIGHEVHRPNLVRGFGHGQRFRFLKLDLSVKRAASHDEVCMRMMSVPAVGPIASLTFKAAVDDPTRFKRSRIDSVHFGLTPRRYQSGEHDNPGRISKAGDRDVRATLYAAANALLMRTVAGSQIKSWGMRLIRTKGRRRAIVAVARKLAVLLHRMWVDGTEFRQENVGGMA